MCSFISKSVADYGKTVPEEKGIYEPQEQMRVTLLSVSLRFLLGQ